MKKKAIIIAAIACAAVAVLGTGGYLAKGIIEYNAIEQACPSVDICAEPYPYADIEIPENFRELSVKGVDFMAPDGLYWKYPEETEGARSGLLVNGEIDDEDYIGVLVLDPDTFDIESEELMSAEMKKKIRKMGYDVPEDMYSLMKLIYSIKLEDCNKFSPSEVSAFKSLALYKELIVSEDEKVYSSDSEGFDMFIKESASDGNYQLDVDCYEKNDPNRLHIVVVMCADPDTARQIVKTIKTAEE